MHEFSIADALASQVRRYAPPSARVAEVEIRVGALRGIEPDALRMCWDAVIHGTELAGCVLRIDALPWTITCASCGSRWESPVPFVVCACGNAEPVPSAGDELDLVSLTVQEDAGGTDALEDGAPERAGSGATGPSEPMTAAGAGRVAAGSAGRRA